ncbi:cuticle protein CP1158-like [Homarus americanus]|nr:cuticle protein CP1158-like [Homarus americanus]
MKLLATICMLAVGVSAQVGYSGIVSPTGANTQFSHEFAANIVLIGPSGIVTANGENRQLTAGEAQLHAGAHPVPVPHYVAQNFVYGPSGYITPTGQNVQYTHEQAANIVLTGPSGIVSRDGQNIQFPG